MKRAAPELHPPTIDEFKDFVRRVISVPKREVDQKLAEQHRERSRRVVPHADDAVRRAREAAWSRRQPSPSGPSARPCFAALLRQSTWAWVVSAIVLVLAAAEVAVERGLFADGSAYLVRILQRRSFLPFDQYRTYADHLTQAPVVLGLELGVRDIHTLTLLHSFGLFAFPVLAWLVALYKLRNDVLFWPFVLLFAIVYFNTSVMAIDDCNLAYAFTGCSMALLLRRNPVTVPDGLLLVAMAACLMRVYEAMVFLGPLLCLLAGAKFVEAHRTGYYRGSDSLSGRVVGVCLVAAAALFVASAAIAFSSLSHYSHPENLSGAKDYSLLFKNKQLVLSLAVGLFYSLLVLPGRIKVVDAVVAPAALAAVVALAMPSHWATPHQFYDTRAWVGLFELGFAGVLVVPRFLLPPDADVPRSVSLSLAAIPLSLFLVLGSIDLYHSWHFDQFLSCYRGEVNSRTGLVPLAQTKLYAGGCGQYDWGWTHPSMSLLLRKSTSGAIILNAGGGYQPFDPKVSVPDLSRYY